MQICSFVLLSIGHCTFTWMHKLCLVVLREAQTICVHRQLYCSISLRDFPSGKISLQVQILRYKVFVKVFLVLWEAPVLKIASYQVVLFYPISPKDAIRALKKRLNGNKNYREVMLALTVSGVNNRVVKTELLEAPGLHLSSMWLLLCQQTSQKGIEQVVA